MKPLSACDQCGSLVKSLRRHHRRHHASTVPYAAVRTAEPASEPEDWQTEPQCSVSLPGTPPTAAPASITPPTATPASTTPPPAAVPTPTPSPSSPTRDFESVISETVSYPTEWPSAPGFPTAPLPPPPSPTAVPELIPPPEPTPSPAEPPPAVARTVSRGTQESGDYDPRERVRSRLFGRRRDLLSVFPQNPVDYGLLTEEEHLFSRRIDPEHRRRHCSCRRCVEHAIRLGSLSHPSGLPRVRGFRFVTPPALPDRLSSPDQRRRLVELTDRRPELLTLACGCTLCVAHRNLVTVWSRAMELTELVRRHPRRGEVVVT